MADEGIIAELTARLERVEAENRRLTEALDRRGLFRKVGAVAAGAAAAAVAAPAVAAADSGAPLILGGPPYVNFTDRTTSLEARYPASGFAFNVSGGWVYSTGGVWGVSGGRDSGAGVLGESLGGSRPGVRGISPDGVGVHGVTSGTYGVHGHCENEAGIGVFGDGSYGAIGVYGHSGSNHAVVGISNSGNGVHGHGHEPGATGVLGRAVEPSGYTGPAGVTGDSFGHPGVQGFSATSDGVVGRSRDGRGGTFAGSAAAVRLVPGPTLQPPTAGATGDLYADSAGRLWYCRQGGPTATWFPLVS